MPGGEPSLDSVVAEALRPFFAEASGSLPELRKEILSTTSRLRQTATNGAEHCIPLLPRRASAHGSGRDHAATLSMIPKSGNRFSEKTMLHQNS
jgi:hypothetical protein